MSAAAAAATDAAPAPKKGGKKLIIILAVVALLVLGGGGGAFYFIQKKKAAEAAAEAEDGGEAPAKVEHAAGHKVDPSHPPTFVPLDNFTVNLADTGSERFAQIGITLQVDDPKFAESMKGFMPAIRNGILMILAHKNSSELLTADGKEQLAAEIMREAVRPMGIEVDEEDDAHAADAGASKKKKKKKPVHNPVEKVLFSSFIVQ